ncbi:MULTISPECIES: hypothetical protein [Methylomonas]|uniref:hypothetical protein n=1 Tax=Methylomonas TaxID=416 RepID=UPI0018D5E50C|nr:hypothetical protein [Methylomonas rhizoryzae]
MAIELPWLDSVEQAKAPKRLPVVLNRDEIQAILLRLNGTPHLIASLLYGTGMRIMGACGCGCRMSISSAAKF